MLYSIVKTELAIMAGFSTLTHRTYMHGEYLVLNENELRRIDDNIEDAATMLGGTIMEYGEAVNRINELKIIENE